MSRILKAIRDRIGWFQFDGGCRNCGTRNTKLHSGLCNTCTEWYQEELARARRHGGTS